MGRLTLAVVHSDTSSLAVLVILCPGLAAAKARLLEQHGILAVVLVVCVVVGG